MVKTKMEFEVQAEKESEGTTVYVFDMVCKVPKRGAIRWRVQKTEEQIVGLN